MTGIFIVMLATMLALGACAAVDSPGALPEPEHAAHDDDHHADFDDGLPSLSALGPAEGEAIRAIATTNIVADIVVQVGGEQVDVTSLMPAGADPHGYTPAPQDLRLLNDADVIFVNGLGLEEALLPILTNLDRDVPIVSVNVGVDSVEYGGEHGHHDDGDDDHDHGHGEEHGHHDDDDDDHGHGDDHHHDGDDPHTWQSVRNVMVWVENVRIVLSELDPDHADVFAANAQAYLQELEALDEEIRSLVAQIPEANRKLITDHDTFSYFALDYGFKVVGAVIPSFSTLAAPSAQELAALQDQMVEENVQAIFVGTTVNPALAERVAEDLGIRVVELYSDSLSDADGPAATYPHFMRTNVNRIIEALQ